ncbi:MAG: Hint domain-containing protein, partial [Pseudomonadota bacterium]
DNYEADTPAIWQLGNTNGDPVVRLTIEPDGTISLQGVKANNGGLEPLQLFNGLTVNTAAIEAAWNDASPNTIVIDQQVTGPTNAAGSFVDVACFASGTLIETRHGPVAVEDLRVSDQVMTYDNGPQPIRWIGSCHLTSAQLLASPNLRPIRIRAGALGADYPRQDLVVSPQHRVLVSSAVAIRMFDTAEVLIPAKKLLPLDGVETLENNPDGLHYWHILFDKHEIIWSNGSPTESLYTGPEALKAVSDKGRAEIQTLFPEICKPDFEPSAARLIPESGGLMKKLVERHQMNEKPFL